MSSCSNFKDCCQDKNQQFWVESPKHLFCSLNPVPPNGNITSATRLNSITRLILYISTVMYLYKFKYWNIFLFLGLFFIISLFYATKPPSSKEHFDFEEDYLQKPNSLYIATQQDMTSNITNTTRGSTDHLIHAQSLNPSTARRDVQAGISYYTPNVGTNPRVNVPPIIGPRIVDAEVWGQSKNVFPRTNFEKTRDLSEFDTHIPDLQGVSTSIGVPILYAEQVPNSVVPQNRLNQPTYDGYYPSGQNDVLGGMDERDFKREVMPTYHDPIGERDELLQSIDKGLYENNLFGMTEHNPNHTEEKEEKKKENFYFTTNKNTMLSEKTASQPNGALRSEYGYPGTLQGMNNSYNTMNRVPPGKDWQPHTVMSQMIPQSPTYVYTDDYFAQPDKKLFLQDIQPKLYSYTVDQQPINSNIGISYSPQNPPPVLDQITDNHLSRPIYTRVDPQLVRTDGTRALQQIQPTRTNWSAEYSNFVPPEGSINFEDIYDPRFTSYGDPYRSYSDINLGQVQYYYSDVDAYRMPNFATRSNVDFIEYRTPQGQVWPEYQRTAGVDDVRSHVESQYAADNTFHREDLMALQMNKANRIAWAQRYAPLRQRGANTHTSTYGAGI